MKVIELPWKPHPGQREVYLDEARFKVLACGRRWGKTSFALMQLLKKALIKPGVYWWIAPTNKELMPVSNLIRKDNLQGIFLKKYEETNTYRGLLLQNGSQIWFQSADRPDSLRGEGLSGLVIDEAAMVKRDRWEEELRPALMDNKGWAIFISTPKGRNYFYELFRRGQDPETWPDWKSWRQSSFANSIDNGGYIETKELESSAKDLSELGYRQEILAEFLEGEGSVFRKIDQAIGGSLGYAEIGRNYSLGCDLAKHIDFTVLTALDDLGQVRGFDRFNKLDWVFQKKRIRAFAELYPGLMWIDSTGIGDQIYDELRRDGQLVEGYKFTNESKRQLIENLSIGFDQGKWRIPDDPVVSPLINELESFTYKITPSGNTIYGAPSGLHDDCVISLALAAWGSKYFKPPSNDPVSYVFSPRRYFRDPYDDIRRTFY